MTAPNANAILLERERLAAEANGTGKFHFATLRRERPDRTPQWRTGYIIEATDTHFVVKSRNGRTFTCQRRDGWEVFSTRHE